MRAVIIFLTIVLFSGMSGQTLPNTARDLDKNNVKARINTNNDKFWDINGTQARGYEVPKGQNKHTAFANSIWIGGLDQGNQLHLSANTYKQYGFDFWPGPLDTANISSFSSTASAIYNRLWKIDCNDIYSFATAFNNGSVTANTYTAPSDLLSYPGSGIMNFQKAMAPFVDANMNGIYDPLTGGDYPIIKGHQQVLSIFNDNFGVHGESGAAPMGIEIHERSYSYSDPTIHDSMQAINYTTFYYYTIYNRSSTNYHNVFISDWNDCDLGYFLDDFIGSDTLHDFAYCYNANSFDPTAMGTNGYGNKPPVSSHVLLPTNCSSDGIDNNQNGTIDEPGEHFQMNRVTYYNNNLNTYSPATTNPQVASHYYNYMAGFWKNGSPFTFGGTGFGNGTPTKYVFPGNPMTNSGWTEATASVTPGDRRFLMSSGPFNFPAKSKIEWAYAIVFSQDTSAAVNSITQFNTRVQRDVKNVKYYDAAHQTPVCAPLITTDFQEQASNKKLDAYFYPNPTNGAVTIDLNQDVSVASVMIYNSLGALVATTTINRNYRGSIDLSGLPTGIYFAQINSNGKQVRQKIALTK